MSHYLEEGGFPDVQGTSPRLRIQMLQGYVQSVLYRDVLERHIAWELEDEATCRREILTLKNAMQETGIQDATIVTWDEKERILDGVRIVPVWKWALEESSRTCSFAPK